MEDSLPVALTPTSVRGVKLRNRIFVSPMCTYSAEDGMANDFHLVHLGRFALGGAAMVFVEATAYASNTFLHVSRLENAASTCSRLLFFSNPR